MIGDLAPILDIVVPHIYLISEFVNYNIILSQVTHRLFPIVGSTSSRSQVRSLWGGREATARHPGPPHLGPSRVCDLGPPSGISPALELWRVGKGRIGVAST